MVTVRLFVSYSGPATIETVSLTASCTPPLFLTTDAVTLPSVAGGNRTPTIVPFTFRARADELPVDLTACVAATYTVNSGEPRCARCEFVLPFSMVASVTPPVKNPKFKVTLDTNRPPPPLAALFEDLLVAQATCFLTLFLCLLAQLPWPARRRRRDRRRLRHCCRHFCRHCRCAARRAPPPSRRSHSWRRASRSRAWGSSQWSTTSASTHRFSSRRAQAATRPPISTASSAL